LALAYDTVIAGDILSSQSENGAKCDLGTQPVTDANGPTHGLC